MERDEQALADAKPVEPQDGKSASDLPIKEHILMVNDIARGERYRAAMKEKIHRGDIVLEVGTGAGLLSCIAASLGARHVYTVEQSPILHRVAQKVLQANGLADKVTLIHAHSKDLQGLKVIKEPVDVFVTETIGTQGLDEGILSVFEHIKPLLARKARVIPESVVFKHCLVNMMGIRERTEVLQPILGFDMSALNAEIESNNLYVMQPLEPWREVSTTADTRSYDLLNFKPGESTQRVEIISDNVCDGMLTWPEFRLSKNVSIDTRYRHSGCSWANSVHFMQRCNVAVGQSCVATFSIKDDRLGWTLNWQIGPKP